VVQTIHEIVQDHKAIKHINEVVTMHMGPDYILVNVSVDFADGVPAGDVERAVFQLNQKLKQALPRVKRVFIEAEAAKNPP
jgi:divalent metal cation (Fe/Co/Zn/Cd) transporter